MHSSVEGNEIWHLMTAPADHRRHVTSKGIKNRSSIRQRHMDIQFVCKKIQEEPSQTMHLY